MRITRPWRENIFTGFARLRKKKQISNCSTSRPSNHSCPVEIPEPMGAALNPDEPFTEAAAVAPEPRLSPPDESMLSTVQPETTIDNLSAMVPTEPEPAKENPEPADGINQAPESATPAVASEEEVPARRGFFDKLLRRGTTKDLSCDARPEITGTPANELVLRSFVDEVKLARDWRRL